MIYVGLDLHKRYMTACAIDGAGQLIAEERRLLTDLTVVSAWLGRLTGPVTVVLEATLYWAWLEQQLIALRYTVRVAHPYQVKLIWHARTAATAARAGLLVRQRPVLKNRIHAYLTGKNLRFLAVDLSGRGGPDWRPWCCRRLCAATSISCSPISISSPHRSSRSTNISTLR